MARSGETKTQGRPVRGAVRPGIVALTGLVALVARPGAATAAPGEAAPTVTRCVDAHARVQELRKQHLLLEAREALKGCLSAQCPALVRSDCYTWTDELERETPSVIFLVTGRAVQLVDAHVFVDGASDEIATSGAPLRLDPGRHTYRVEHAGHTAVARDFVVFAGQRFLQINVDLEPVTDPKPAGAPPPAPPPAPELHRPVPAATWALLALGVAGAGGFAGFGTAGRAGQRALESSCSPACSDAQLGGVRWKYLAADVSMGVGAAALVASGLTYLLRPAKERAPTVAIIPGPTGFQAGLVWKGL